MTIRLAPLIPLLPLLIGLLVYLIAVALCYKGYRGIVSQRHWRMLIATKMLSAAGVVLLLLNPYFVRPAPDTTTFNVAMLVDATASMDTRDCSDTSRLETVKTKLLAEDSEFRHNVLQAHENLNAYVFAGESLRRFDINTDFDSLPGDTDIDLVLRKLISNNIDSNTLGAVLLVTDGLDNRGVGLLDGSKRYKSLGIPIHCIGVGDNRQKSDLGVTWTSVPDKAEKSKPFTMTAVVSRNFKGNYTARVEVRDGVRLVHEREVSFIDDQKELSIEIEHTSYVAGFEPLRIHVLPLPEEVNTLNNVDYSGTDVSDPFVFSTFYYSANLDWDFKFLKLFMEAEERMRLSAVIRIGEDSYYTSDIAAGKTQSGDNGEAKTTTGSGAETTVDELVPVRVDGFPDSSVVNEHSCMVIDLNSLYMFDDAALQTIVNFVENRGGGVIFTGVAPEIPEPIRKLLPIRTMPTELIGMDDAGITFLHSSVLARRSLENLHELADHLSMPPEGFFYKIPPENIKPGALTVATVKGLPLVVLAAQNYGAGKVAFLNIEDTWKWVMHDDHGDRYFGVFWGQLVSWVSSSSKKRMTVNPNTSRLDMAQEQEFSVDILDAEYIPDNRADIVATISTPDGDEETMRLFLNPKIDGRYTGKFIPRGIGEYRFRFGTALHTGEKMEQVVDYLVVNLSPEVQPQPIAETRLQSLARVTGGEYWNYRDVDSIDELPITRAVSFIEEMHEWLKYWLWLVVLLLTVIPDWYVRRRLGLR